MTRTPRRALVLVAVALSLVAGCRSQASVGVDPALVVGAFAIGASETELVRRFGAGTAGSARDALAVSRPVRLYRSASSLVALAFDRGRLVDVEAYAVVPETMQHGVFTFVAAHVVELPGRPLASYLWLGIPLFSDVLPQTPRGWHLPTDFTVNQQDVPFLITSDDRTHLASKQQSRSFHWVVSVR